ncbi:hypothetical protein C5D04_11290 [Rathayibacter sp. AY1D2]|uniref:TIGR02391 family protein n=1 Tax=Rathayibacter sp. AY1D2 TaxID=2080543 RepID=UPI000CE8AEB5|nr:TIGR02391 family protein [Rathayibacter sp. AY1D2]PPI12788.1 hypothetical protein C5D04_11290 [Rathayibacter sp. AY1D2]
MSDDEKVQWMRNTLLSYLEILELDGYEHLTEKAQGLEVSRRILAEILPNEPFYIDMNQPNWYWDVKTPVAKAIGVLNDWSNIRKYLDAEPPTTPSDSLHPVVWGAAKDLWKIGHHREAVARAATFLNAHIQDKSTRTDISDKSLMGQVFSDGAASEKTPRLRWSGSGSSETTMSMRNGLAGLAQGIFMTIRNPASHETAQIDPQMALEQLATLSLLARWVDECQLDTGTEARRSSDTPHSG